MFTQLLILTLKCSCGWSSRIPDHVYFTTSPSVDELHAAGSDLNTHLVAPAAASYSQYFQHLPQLNYYQQAAQLSPFLYTGPLIMMLTQAEQSAQSEEAESSEKSFPTREENSYRLYRPIPADNPQFVDMQPPSEAQDELDYYIVKPKKNKKYSAAVEEKKKYTKKKENLKARIVQDEQEDLNDAKEETDYDYDAPSSSTEVPTSAKLTNDSDSSRKERDTDSSEKTDTADDSSVETSAPASRLDFQMHGNY